MGGTRRPPTQDGVQGRWTRPVEPLRARTPRSLDGVPKGRRRALTCGTAVDDYGRVRPTRCRRRCRWMRRVEVGGFLKPDGDRVELEVVWTLDTAAAVAPRRRWCSTTAAAAASFATVVVVDGVRRSTMDVPLNRLVVRRHHRIIRCRRRRRFSKGINVVDAVEGVSREYGTVTARWSTADVDAEAAAADAVHRGGSGGVSWRRQ